MQYPSSRGAALLAELSADRLGLPDEALELRPDEPMSKHTTLRLGGPADLWVRPRTDAALRAILERTHALEIPVRSVGGGTNLLVRDGGLRGVVINLARLNQVRRGDFDGDDVDDAKVVHVQAGCSTGRLLKHATDWGLGGVEFLGGVPGSVGGGLVMNAGTYLGEFTDVVTRVTSVARDGTTVTRTHAECGFRYRASDLPPDEIVVGARFELQPRDRAQIQADVAGLRARRKAREPSGVPNNGSTFKNPPGDYAGRIIESLGLKGLRRGGAIVSPKHANWLVVDKHVVPPCTAADLIALIEAVEAEVLARTGIGLDREVKIVGEPA